jgi:hypothetical protein
MSTARVLTVRQPWASAIIYAGNDVENRTWPTRYRGLLYIHAGMALEPDDVLPLGTPVHRSAIIGHVTHTGSRVSAAGGRQRSWRLDHLGIGELPPSPSGLSRQRCFRSWLVGSLSPTGTMPVSGHLVSLMLTHCWHDADGIALSRLPAPCAVILSGLHELAHLPPHSVRQHASERSSKPACGALRRRRVRFPSASANLHPGLAAQSPRG